MLQSVPQKTKLNGDAAAWNLLRSHDQICRHIAGILLAFISGLLDVKDVFLLGCVIHTNIIYYFIIVSVLNILINITTSKTAF